MGPAVAVRADVCHYTLAIDVDRHFGRAWCGVGCIEIVKARDAAGQGRADS